MKLVIILITTLFFLGCKKDKTTDETNDGTNEVTAEETADATEETAEVTTEVSSFTCSENLSYRSVKPIDSNGSFPCSSDASSQCFCEFYVTQDGQETLISKTDTTRIGCLNLEQIILIGKYDIYLNYIAEPHMDKRSLHIDMNCSLSN